MRIYDARIAKFLSVDPLIMQYPFYSPYIFAGNMPIMAIDLDGLEPLICTEFADLEELRRKVNINYSVTGTGNNKNYSVSLTQPKYGIAHTLSSNSGPKQSELGISYAFSHPGNAIVLNKINNMAIRRNNYLHMAFVDIADAIGNNLKAPKNYENKDYDNAFLHLTGQAAITVLFGKGYATLAGDAHERDQKSIMTGDFEKDKIENTMEEEITTAIDSYADLINNEWGKRWGSSIAKELKITTSTHFTNQLTSKFMNSLQKNISKTMGIKFSKNFTNNDQIIKRLTLFFNSKGEAIDPETFRK